MDYRQAGVDIDAGNEVVRRIRTLARGTFTPGVLSEIGVSNASLGVQTFAAHCQEAIGRIQPLCMIEHGVRILREAGVRSINFDLMYGLPQQTVIRAQQSVEAALTLPWSTGPVEGRITQLKLIKRQMYGRANFDLLRCRILLAA